MKCVSKLLSQPTTDIRGGPVRSDSSLLVLSKSRWWGYACLGAVTYQIDERPRAHA
jgi:hypothetical protein